MIINFSELKELLQNNSFFFAIRAFTTWMFSQFRNEITTEEYKLYQHLFEALRIFNILFEEIDMLDPFKEDKEIYSSRKWIRSIFIENLEFTLSKIAHNLIKINPQKKKDITLTALNNLFKSKAMSGGLKSKFFSSYFWQHMHIFEIWAQITGDKKLTGELSNPSISDEEKILMNIIHEGQNESVDWFINLLQWTLLKKNPILKAGGEEGMKVSRAAFAAILSLNENYKDCSFTNLWMFLDQIELTVIAIDDKSNQNDVFEQIAEDVSTFGSLNPFLERWQSASKMRVWLQEMRKNISNDLLQQTEKETLVQEEEIKLFTEEEAKEDIIVQEQKAIDALVQKVFGKAEFLINLSAPLSWKHFSKFKKDEKIHLENLAFSAKDSKKTSLKKLKTLIRKQTFKGSVISYENLTNKDVFNSCSTSVLAILQWSLEETSIIDGLFNHLNNCIKRLVGLSFSKKLLSGRLRSPKLLYHHSLWFYKALNVRNYSELSHYSDNLNGVGDYLMSKLR
jgi:hypothetical protein